MTGLAAKLLDRDLARVQVDPIRRVAEPLLRDVIDRGIETFVGCNHTAPDGDENIAVLFPFHHVLEMADGVQILLAESSVAASQPLLRSAFEALVGIKYVLSEDTSRRAMSYVVADIKERLRWYDSMDPATERGRQYREAINAAENPDYPFPSAEEIERGRRKLSALLSQEKFMPHSEEYDRTKKMRRRPPEWYALYNGPRTFRDLTKQTGDLDDY